jgi:peptide/nickel transport system permease protein
MTTIDIAPRPPSADVPVAERRTRHRGFLRQSLRLARTQIGLVIVALVVGVAVFGPYFAPHSTTEFVGAPFSGASPTAHLGADYLGRDVLSRFLSGGREILIVGLLGTVVAVGAGTALGLLSGYAPRWVDEALMRVVDLLLAFPGIVLALLAISVVGAHGWVLVLVVGLTYMPYTGRIVRSSTMQVRESDFVRYAEGTGMPLRRILSGEILANIAAPLTVEFGLRLTHSIALIAGLDYLGLGVAQPAADWGLMTHENESGLTVAPLSVLLPVLAIVLLTVGANLVTDGIGHAAAGVDRSLESE